MFRREPATYLDADGTTIKPVTLDYVHARLDLKGEALTAAFNDIVLHLDDDEPSIRIGKRNIPATTGGVVALGARYDVPKKFMERLDPDLRQHLLSGLMARDPKAHIVVVNDEGILEVRSSDSKQIDPRRIVEIARDVVGDDARVLDWYRDSGREFRLDVATSEKAKTRGLYGDRKVGDLTAAGLRFTQDLRQEDQFHAPQIALLLWRLKCTNGMEMVDEEAKVDARGATVDQVLEEYERLAQVMFAGAENAVNAFYDLRNNKVSSPEQWMLRFTDEHEVPDRIRLGLVERIPSLGDDVTEFDLINLITNEANNPLINRESARRVLQQAGGTAITEHAARCSHCASKVA